MNKINQYDLDICSNEKEILEVRRQSADNIYEISKNISRLVDQYSDESSTDIVDDPLRVFDEIGSLSKELKKEWDAYFSKLNEIKIRSKPDQDAFREAYMSMTTQAFSEELDDLRHGRIPLEKKKDTPDILKQQNIVIPDGSASGNGDIQVDVLVHILGHGMDQWTEEEKALLLKYSNIKRVNTNGIEVERLTPHEKRRRAEFGSP